MKRTAVSCTQPNPELVMMITWQAVLTNAHVASRMLSAMLCIGQRKLRQFLRLILEP